LQHISDWAKHHNLKLNQSKSLEIIISLRTPPISAATFLTRVDSLTVLGVTFNSKLRFDLHVFNIIDKAARALYGLKTIRSHGLTKESLHDVTRATLIARLIYAAPAWWGFVSLAERDRIQSVIKKPSAMDIGLAISLMSLVLLMLLIPTYSITYCVTQTMFSTN